MEYKFLEDMKQAFSVWLDCIDKILQENTRLQEEVGEYRTALEEIREMAKDAYDNDQEYQATGVYNEILDKINEVLK